MTAQDRQLASGCLLGSFTGTYAPAWLLNAVGDGLGGVLLFAQNVVDDAQVKELCAQIRDARGDVVIAIDEEGGDVTRLDATTGSAVPSPAAFGYVDDVRLTADAHADLGARIRSLGIDVTLAPCADINSNPRNPIIGVRSFGTSADVVGRHVAAAIAGFHRGGVAVCAKHFPGHGDTVADTHLGPARVTAAMAEMSRRELIPFATAIDSGADAILTAHIVVDAFDSAPVSLSAAWNGYLRDVMGFGGVIITDALDMDAVADRCGVDGVADAAVRAAEAGADMLCLGSNFDAFMVNTVIERIVAALSAGQLDRGRMEDSLKRVAGLCASAHRRQVSNTAAAHAVAARAIVVDGRAPSGPYAVLECRPPGNMACFNVSWGIADDLRERGWPVALLTAADPIEEAVAAELDAAGDMPVLVVVRNEALHPWQSAVIDAATQARPGSVVVVEFGWPANKPARSVTSIVTHGAARSSALAVLDLLDARTES